MRQYINSDDKILPADELFRRASFGVMEDGNVLYDFQRLLCAAYPVISRSGAYLAQSGLDILVPFERKALKAILSKNNVLRAIRYDGPIFEFYEWVDLRNECFQKSRPALSRRDPENETRHCERCGEDKLVWDFQEKFTRKGVADAKVYVQDAFHFWWKPDRVSVCYECRAVAIDLCSNARSLRFASCGEFHSDAEWKMLLSKFEFRCVRCGSTKRISKDHVVPLSRGGSDAISNIQPLCRECNSWKHVRTIDFRDNPCKEHLEIPAQPGVSDSDPSGDLRSCRGIRNAQRLVAFGRIPKRLRDWVVVQNTEDSVSSDDAAIQRTAQAENAVSHRRRQHNDVP